MTLDCDPQPRRILYLVPLASIATGYGIATIVDSSWYLANILYLIVISLKSMEKYVLTAQVDSITTNIMHYIYPKTYQAATIDYSIILTFLLIYLLIAGIYFCIRKYRRQFFMAASIVLTVLFISTVHPLFSEVSLHGNDLKMKLIWTTPYYPEVVNFYRNHSIDDQRTLCFYCHELLTFTNNKFIDFTSKPVEYAFKILDRLNEKTSLDNFLSYLLSINVSHILIPTEKAKLIQSIYIPYMVLYNNTILGDLVRDIRCEIIGRTTYFYIAKLHEKFELNPLNYSEVIPWNYIREKSFNFTVMGEEIVFQGYPPKNLPLSVLFKFKDPVSLDHPIIIDLAWKGDVSRVIVILFSDLSNRQTDYLKITYLPEERIVINKFIGTKVGAFNEKHIEAIYIGLLSATSDGFNESITLNVKGLYFVSYTD